MTYSYTAGSLQHHGVLGQKWGVRRYQNKDGTLTAAGKKHVKENKESVERESFNNQVKSMSDAELRDAVKRLQLEKQYKQLVRDEKVWLKNGQDFVDKIFKDAGIEASKETTKKLMTKGLQFIINAGFGKKVI